jgi:hypothetical protein
VGPSRNKVTPEPGRAQVLFPMAGL